MFTWSWVYCPYVRAEVTVLFFQAWNRWRPSVCWDAFGIQKQVTSREASHSVVYHQPTTSLALHGTVTLAQLHSAANLGGREGSSRDLSKYSQHSCLFKDSSSTEYVIQSRKTGWIQVIDMEGSDWYHQAGRTNDGTSLNGSCSCYTDVYCSLHLFIYTNTLYVGITDSVTYVSLRYDQQGHQLQAQRP
jgi:hypothetical protein